MKKVPEEMIFTADQRLGREGCDWAPKTLMNLPMKAGFGQVL